LCGNVADSIFPNLKGTDDMKKIILRQNWGSYRIVRRVFAYDPRGTACVLLVSGDATDLEMVNVSELEAVDENNNFVDVHDELMKRARFVLDRANVPAF
jgi:hypothetical protein